MPFIGAVSTALVTCFHIYLSPRLPISLSTCLPVYLFTSLPIYQFTNLLPYPPPGTFNRAPTAYPTSALAVPISAISSPLFPGCPTVTRAL